MGALYFGLVTRPRPRRPAASSPSPRLLRRHDLCGAARGPEEHGAICGNILFIVFAAFIFSYAISLAGVGESLTAWIVGCSSRVAVPARAAGALHRARLPRREPRHDRDHGAAALPVLCATASTRSGSASCSCCTSRSARSRRRSASTFRHPEPVGREARGRRDGHDPVPPHHVRGRCSRSGRKSRSGCRST